MSGLHASLLWKLMLAFVIIVLVAVGTIALVARQTTTQEFHRLRQGQASSTQSVQTERFASYYAQQSSWESVSTLIAERRGQGQGQGRSGQNGGPPLRLADASGRVLLDTANTANETASTVGTYLSPGELAQGEPVIVAGERVGTLLVGGGGSTALSQAEQLYLDRVQRALLLSALIAFVVALALGFLLFRSITAPLRHLTQATTAVAAGDLSTRVPVKSQDEIGQLAQSFNTMTADLARADRLRRDMTADIAHELRTPLTVIQGNLEAILEGVYPPDAEHLEPVLRKTQLLKRLVEDLRTLAMADAGELTLHRSRLDLGALVQRTAHEFKARARSAHVRLTHQVPDQTVPVDADAARLEQVLGILLDNALCHTPEGGHIDVALQTVTEAESGDKQAQVSVQDDGEGIPAEALPHVFERFYRAPSGTARISGSGLGLAIAQAIISAHGGHIGADSHINQGTQVKFTLPLQD